VANAHVIAGYALEALGSRRKRRAVELYLKEDPKGPNAKRAQEAVARLTKVPLPLIGAIAMRRGRRRQFSLSQ